MTIILTSQIIRNKLEHVSIFLGQYKININKYFSSYLTHYLKMVCHVIKTFFTLFSEEEGFPGLVSAATSCRYINPNSHCLPCVYSPFSPLLGKNLFLFSSLPIPTPIPHFPYHTPQFSLLSSLESARYLSY